jgi:hypothetical protein
VQRRRVEVPVGDPVGADSRKVVVGHSAGRGEHARIGRVAIHHGEAVDCPGLPTGPGRPIRVTLLRSAKENRPGVRVIDHVIGASVGTDEVVERLERMAHCHVAPRLRTAVLRAPQQELDVHQVDDDGVVPGRVPVPGEDHPVDRVVARGERACGREQHVPVVGVARGPPGVAIARIHRETHVVRLRVRLQNLQRRVHWSARDRAAASPRRS